MIFLNINILIQIKTMANIITRVIEFVKKTTQGRDSSHGLEHMKQVEELTIEILNGEGIFDTEIRTIAQIVALLHDVADHKYNVDPEVVNKLLIQEKLDNERIMKLIDLISYSKEVADPTRLDKLSWDDLIIRNAVSDADKITAIGETGIKRCITYTKHTHPQCTDNQINTLVIKHANEKLLRLKDLFIRTKTGKTIAEIHHQRMIEILSTLTTE